MAKNARGRAFVLLSFLVLIGSFKNAVYWAEHCRGDVGQGYWKKVSLKISEDELREQILACHQEQIAGQPTRPANVFFEFEQILFSILTKIFVNYKKNIFQFTQIHFSI